MMKKALLINIFLILVFNTQAQLNESFKKWIELKDLNFLLLKLDSLSSNNDFIELNRLHERELTENVTEFVFEIEKEIPIDKNTSKLEIYKFELISNEGNIINYRVWDFRNLCKKHIYLNFSDKKAMSKFILQYRKNFDYNIDTTQLYSDSVAYGYSCEILEYNNKERDSLEKAIDENNPELCLSWIKSPNLELQLFGYEGMLRLIENGYVADKKTINILIKIMDKHGIIGTNLECLFYRKRFEHVIKTINTRYNKVYAAIARL